MSYSLTYSGVIVMVIGFIFQLAGVPLAEGNAESFVKFGAELIGVIMALYGRYRLGGINALGGRKG